MKITAPAIEIEGVTGLLGIAPSGIELTPTDTMRRSTSHWLIRTAVGVMLLDNGSRFLTCYPRDGRLRKRGIWDRQPRSVERVNPPIVGESWSFREVLPDASRNDPWGSTKDHPVGEVLAVVGLDL